MSRIVTSAAVRPFYDEDDIRRLCGLSVFAQADAMQRAGHVTGAERTPDTISGDVRGLWRRVDRVSILTKGNRLQPSCARHGSAFCQHTGALLLHWLREPEVIQFAEQDVAARLSISGLEIFWDDDPDISTASPFEIETAEAEIARHLEAETIAVIREMARRRGVAVRGARKAEVVADAATGMADPANIDAAIAGLPAPERLLLDAAQISSPTSETTDARAFDVYRMLGGQGQPPLDALRDLGLVFSSDIAYYRGRIVRVPHSVVARLPPRAGLATPIDDAKAPESPEHQPGLTLMSLITIVAQDSLSGGSSAREEFVNPHYGVIPSGFVVHPSDQDRLMELMRSYDANERIRLIVPPTMPAADLGRLARQSGQPDEVVEFAARLMISLRIAEQLPRLTIDPEMLRRLLELDAFSQLSLLVNGWLSMAGWAESSLIFGDGGPIRFAWNPRHPAPHVSTAIAEGVGLVSRLAGRMQPGVWYDASSFVETVEKLAPSGAPSLATFRQSSQYLDLTWHGRPRPGQRLQLRAPEGWTLLIRALVDAVLSGPMAWLGLVDVQQEPGGVTVFRMRPTATILSGKQLDPEDLIVPGKVTVDADLSIVVPAGSASIAALAPILHATELTRAADDRLRYQMTPNGIQTLFESGMSAGDIDRLLAEQAGGQIPKAARATLDRWWNAYGGIRLYDELTLIELGDDLLLRELQATTSLASVMLYQFTPRLIAVEDDAVDQLVTELGARGYAPRIVEGG